jgi:hypothetical protein
MTLLSFALEQVLRARVTVAAHSRETGIETNTALTTDLSGPALPDQGQENVLCAIGSKSLTA